jgi:LysM repeat protein
MTEHKPPAARDEGGADRPLSTIDILYHLSCVWRGKWEGIKDEVLFHIAMSAATLLFVGIAMPSLGITASTLLEMFANQPQTAAIESASTGWPTTLTVQLEYVPVMLEEVPTTGHQAEDPTAPIVIEVTRVITVVVTATPAPVLTSVASESGGACPDMYLRPAPPGSEHEVMPGETLEGLAARYGTNVATLVGLNRSYYPTLAERPDCIRDGWWLVVR